MAVEESGVGDAAGSRADDGAGGSVHRWRRRGVLAWLLGVTMVVLAVAAGLVAAGAAAAVMPQPTGVPGRMGWWSVVLVSSVAGAAGAERLTRRLLPLRALLGAALAFPGKPPSRWRVAARRGSTEQMLGRLREARIDAEAAGDAEAMTRMLILVTALQAHDPRTRGHAERVRMFCDLLTETLGMDEEDRDRIRWAALLHDIGKIDVPHDVLRGDQPLDADEWSLIKRHPQRGMELCEPLADWLGPHAQGIGQHHERFDGDGYPAGIAGKDIAISARIIAVVDAFEVMTGPRTYQRRRSVGQARRELVANAGTQFDPAIVRAFLTMSVLRLIAVTGPLSMIGVLGLLRVPPAAAASATAAVLSGVVAVTGVLGFSPTQGVDETQVDGAETAFDEGEAGGITSGAPIPPAAESVAPSTSPATPIPSTSPPDLAGLELPGPLSPPAVAVPLPAGPAGSPPAGANGAPVPPPAAPATAPAPLPPPALPTGGGGSAPAEPTATDPPSGERPTASPAPAPPPAPRPTPRPTPTPTPEPAPAGPTVVADSFTVPRNTTTILDVLANDRAPAGSELDPASVRILSQPQHGEARVLSDGRVELTTQPGYRGADEFTYEVCTTEGPCGEATVTLEIVT
ncbi:hypothetical protein BH23ACT9_BH23ACT9_08240 [soil metagenome]